MPRVPVKRQANVSARLIAAGGIVLNLPGWLEAIGVWQKQIGILGLTITKPDERGRFIIGLAFAVLVVGGGELIRQVHHHRYNRRLPDIEWLSPIVHGAPANALPAIGILRLPFINRGHTTSFEAAAEFIDLNKGSGEPFALPDWNISERGEGRRLTVDAGGTAFLEVALLRSYPDGFLMVGTPAGWPPLMDESKDPVKDDAGLRVRLWGDPNVPATAYVTFTADTQAVPRLGKHWPSGGPGRSLSVRKSTPNKRGGLL